jgi:hypothetical protein
MKSQAFSGSFTVHGIMGFSCEPLNHGSRCSGDRLAIFANKLDSGFRKSDFEMSAPSPCLRNQ